MQAPRSFEGHCPIAYTALPRRGSIRAGIPRSYLPRHWFGKYNEKVIDHTRRKYVEEVDSYGMYFLDGEFDNKIKMVHHAGA